MPCTHSTTWYEHAHKRTSHKKERQRWCRHVVSDSSSSLLLVPRLPQLQFCAFDSARLDAICTSLTPHKWFNPHKSIFGIGNYDVNVLMRALAGYGLTMRWFDRRRDLDQVPLESTFGLILNLPSRTVGVFGARHWLCFKRFASGEWYMIDSDFPASKDPKATPKQKAHRIEDVRATRAHALWKRKPTWTLDDFRKERRLVPKRKCG